MKYILDIETNGLLLDATTVWCVVLREIGTNNVHTFDIYDEFDGLQEMLYNAEEVIGHNIVMYDLPVLERLLGIKVKCKVFDTILMSRVLKPDREGGHSLKNWGLSLGIPKTEYDQFEEYTPEMLEYCIQDTNVTLAVYNKILLTLEKLQAMGSSMQFVELEHKVAKITLQQIINGFSFNVTKAEELEKVLRHELNEIKEELIDIMPKIDSDHFLSCKKKGLLLSYTDTEYTYLTEKSRQVKTKPREKSWANPTSRDQLAAFLVELGWEPTEFTETGKPQLNDKSLNESNLHEAKIAARMFRLQKQLGMIADGDNAWLKMYRNRQGDFARIHGDVNTNGANTGRMTHAKPNTSQVDKKDKRMRAVWQVTDDKLQVGFDAASLESRILGHFLAIFGNEEYGQAAISQDIHEYNKNTLNLNTRAAAKGIYYAVIYGAGPYKLGTLVQKDRELGFKTDTALRSLGVQMSQEIKEKLVGYKELLESVQTAIKKRGFLWGLDGRPLHVRETHSALNLLIQSTGAIIMKQAVINLVDNLNAAGYTEGVDWMLVAQIHDECQLEVKPEHAEAIAKIGVESIRQTTQQFKLNCPMDGEYKIGRSWAETH